MNETKCVKCKKKFRYFVGDDCREKTCDKCLYGPLTDEIAKLRRENTRLRKLVAKLPVSGDELPIVPKSKVWVKGRRETVSLVHKNYVTLGGVYGEVNAFDCFFRKPKGKK